MIIKQLKRKLQWKYQYSQFTITSLLFLDNGSKGYVNPIIESKVNNSITVLNSSSNSNSSSTSNWSLNLNPNIFSTWKIYVSPYNFKMKMIEKHNSF
jgi:hypothetical protein